MATPKIAILDYGVGNLFNVRRALDHVGAASAILRDPKAILRADKLVLPGVGAFEAGIARLRRDGLDRVVRDFRKTGRPILGICLGMQLLMTESEENGLHAGLGIVPGRVVRFRPPLPGRAPFKIPQIGWNSLEPARRAKGDPWRGTVLEGLPAGVSMYFVHSYRVQVADGADSLAVTAFGRDRFTSVLRRGNVSGCQFHPERSGDAGLALLRNFVQN
ncbi:MAG: imidazole glycerol phosphate synthase subunit HisH [Elusimicrobia bacterium]|nr:imidazole glycerol phosphate synthase subunit HisH [Elusimicrobiota bacterium]